MRAFSSWDETDLQFLIDSKLGETVEREYKRTICVERPSDRKELCKDASALANSQGGVIVFGLDESSVTDSGSIPVTLSPIDDHSLKEKAQQIILDGVQPRMEFRFYSVAQSGGRGEYVLLEIPKSFRGVHMVTLGGENRYYVRRDFQVVPMTAFEIEEAYRSYVLKEIETENRLARFRMDRFPNVFGPDTWGAWISIVAVPVFPIRDMFVPICFLDRSELSTLSFGTRTRNGLVGVDSFIPSFEGLTAQTRREDGTMLFDHVIFREGGVRTGICFSSRDPKRIGSLGILEQLHNSISFIMGLFCKVGYFAGVKLGCIVTFNNDYSLGVPQSVVETNLRVAKESVGMAQFNHSLEFSPREWQDNAASILGPLMHHLWQTFGFSRCYYFDRKSGRYDKELVLDRLIWVAE